MEGSAFQPITLEWAGKTYTIADDMRAIRRVELVTMRGDVLEALEATGRMLPVDIAEVFANLLTFAGAKVTHREVYRGLFGAGAATEAAQLAAMQVISGIMDSRNPPAGMEAAGDGRPTNRAARRRSGAKRTSSR